MSASLSNAQGNGAFQAFGDFPEGVSVAFIENLYHHYHRDETAVAPQWRDFFQRFENTPALKISQADDSATIRRETLDAIRVLMMIRAYRIRGHLYANLDPLQLAKPKRHAELEPETYGFMPADMDRVVFLDHVLGLESASLKDIWALLKRTYCGTIGIEYMHIIEPEEKRWLQARIEGFGKEVQFTEQGKRAILDKLIQGSYFETFLEFKYTATKRFGIEGAEALLPGLEQIIKRGSALGVEEIVFGMPHRGRLNVLANVMAKPYRAIFHEFDGGTSHPEDTEGSGDVKYHLGSSSDREFDGKRVHLSLTANPSHLEIVDPVVLGKVRAKQDLNKDDARTSVLPVLIHGDAAFAGQGVVAECFGLSGLKGHRTGGSIHFIVNNQIGFTTSPIYSRSSPYPSDVAKIVQAPIFHVNGDDPEAVVHAAKIAVEFRQKFGKPVVIDMFCYRRHGHNESDEPLFTQPLMYHRIAKHQPVAQLYADKLQKEKLIDADYLDSTRKKFHQQLEQDFKAASNYRANKADWLDGVWSGFEVAKGEARRGETGVSMARLQHLGKLITTIPDDFKLHRTLQRLFTRRQEAVSNGSEIDWALAELLAFGSLLEEDVPIRLSGQDSERGTFSQRHMVVIDQDSEKRYIPLKQIEEAGGGRVEVINSMLSEEAVLGFEYGYSLAEPNALVLWEAQFGDFANGAQVVIDQFLSCGERKWLRMSGLTLLLPHGYEGQGPEHSSARIERFLQLCAEDNMQVVNCTAPHNYFHLLRRQMKRNFRKPLIVFTPKSLLRHKKCVSPLAAMAEGSSFHRILRDEADLATDSVGDGGSATRALVADNMIRRVVMCSGKVYFDLLEERSKRDIKDIYLLRVEQLYPFPVKSLITELSRFPQADMAWCQEEPKNMGPWSFIEPNLEWVLRHINARRRRPVYFGRAAACSPATGMMKQHLSQRARLVNEALSDE